MERRINPALQAEPAPKLKQIAGLIQGLSYREMLELAGVINVKLGACCDGSDEQVAERLLLACDDILKKETGK